MNTEWINYGDAWKAEVEKLTKKELIELIRQIQTGTKDKKMMVMNTSKEASRIIEGILNDFESGVSSKKETYEALGEYTGRIMSLFWENAEKKVDVRSVEKFLRKAELDNLVLGLKQVESIIYLKPHELYRTSPLFHGIAKIYESGANPERIIYELVMYIEKRY